MIIEAHINFNPELVTRPLNRKSYANIFPRLLLMKASFPKLRLPKFRISCPKFRNLYSKFKKIYFHEIREN